MVIEGSSVVSPEVRVGRMEREIEVRIGGSEKEGKS